MSQTAGESIMNETVWIVDYVDWPESGGGAETDRVYATRQLAVDAVKARYGDPYKVTWSEKEDGDLVGEFEQVLHFSTKHEALYTFHEARVVGDEGTT